MTEGGKRLRGTCRRDILCKIQYLATQTDRPEQVNTHGVEEFAKLWEKDIWTKSIEQRGGDILDYKADIEAELQMIENWEKKWNIRAHEHLGWSGKEMFQSQADAFFGDLSDKTGQMSQKAGISFIDPSAYSGKEKESRQDPTASEEVAEAKLNSNHVESRLKVGDKRRMILRRSLRGHLEDILTLLPASDPISTVDAATFAASWETRALESAVEHTYFLSEYETIIEEAEQTLEGWKTYWDSTDGDEFEKKTGRELFLDYINQHHTHEIQYMLEANGKQSLHAPAVDQDSNTDNLDDEITSWSVADLSTPMTPVRRSDILI